MMNLAMEAVAVMGGRELSCAVQPPSVVEAWLLEGLVQASSWRFAQLVTVSAPELTNK
jgi:hypothetical protein